MTMNPGEHQLSPMSVKKEYFGQVVKYTLSNERALGTYGNV